MSFARGKHILITGANSGIGFETACSLAGEAKRLILICRDAQRGEAAVSAIRSLVPHADPVLYLADLSSPSSIQQCVQSIEAREDHLDILINNAGGIFFSRRETDDGLEYSFGLNHMGYFRLTRHLLPLLTASGSARIINVASAAHRYQPFDFSDLHRERSYRGFYVYCQSKLANMLFTRELAKRIPPDKFSVAALHPGFIKSKFAQNSQQLGGRLFQLLVQLAGSSPRQGSVTPVFLARADRIIHGGYYTKMKPSRPSPYALDDQKALQLWELSEELLKGGIFPSP